jgi:outer membrane murein-binding lipoprotein Lpp
MKACGALLAAVAALGAGCGGNGVATAGELEATVVQARDQVDFALERVTRSQTEEAFLERMDEAAATIAGAAGELGGVEAAPRFEGDVEELAASVEQLAFDVQATADQVRQPGFDDLLAGARGLSFESWDRVNRALAALAGKGIEVVPLDRH